MRDITVTIHLSREQGEVLARFRREINKLFAESNDYLARVGMGQAPQLDETEALQMLFSEALERERKAQEHYDTRNDPQWLRDAVSAAMKELGGDNGQDK